ncbi:MAG: SGNH/GDSL hydrolase family protein [Winogradskyella sp.]|uniref:SGNH/GDSL hydrolase family protein n=1 Tax=Winogradskyella sp. TaxID=1883156 RepID=UPI001844B05F|nr:SGNH/GDSL hydrolase family protein [Winogradskyella sp.]
MALQIRKKVGVWQHIKVDQGNQTLILSNFYCRWTGDKMEITEPSGKDNASYDYSDIHVFDDTDASVDETFASSLLLAQRLKELDYPGFNTASGGSGANISDAAYGVAWDGDTTEGASKNALYDKINELDERLTNVPYGIIYEKDNFTDTSDFTFLGNASAVATGGKLQATSTSNGTFDQVILLNGETGLGKWKMTLEFELPNAPAATTYGIGIGIRSQASFTPLSNCARVVLTNSAQQGDRYFDWTNTHPGAYTNVVNDLAGTTISQNDTFRITMEQVVNEITITYYNVTTDVEKILTYDFTLPNSPFLANTGQFAIYMIGGTYDITKLKVESKEWKNARLLGLGDSKMNGYDGDTFAGSFMQQLESFYNSIHDNAGGNDTTVEGLLKVPEIISFAPKKVLMNLGSNDKRFGRTLLQWQTDYDDIVTQLEAAGIDVYHLLMLNESVLSFTDYNLHITTTYAADRIVDPGTINLATSGIHPNQTGMNQVFMAIISQIGDVI